MAAADPLFHRDGRAAPKLGTDFELVHEALGAREPEPQAPGGGEAVLQRQRDVANAGALVFGHDDHPLPVAVGETPEADLSALRVHEDVARDFEMAAAITVWSPISKPHSAARSRPFCRALTMSTSDRIGTLDSSGTVQALLAAAVEEVQAFLEVERGGDSLQRQPQLHHGEG